MLDVLFSVEGLAALAALTAMEIVLGIDNVIFLAVLVARLPRERGEFARRLGLALALVFRIAMIFALTSLLLLTEPVVRLFGYAISWRDLILIVGGVFLVVKATHEMHIAAEGAGHLDDSRIRPASLLGALAQIVVVDLVFSIDSAVTAIGMSREPAIMAIAITIAMICMYFSAGIVADFVRRHPSTKFLALAFLILIGVALVAEGMHEPIDRRIIYIAMAFTVLVEALNMRAARRRRLRQSADSDVT